MITQPASKPESSENSAESLPCCSSFRSALGNMSRFCILTRDCTLTRRQFCNLPMLWLADLFRAAPGSPPCTLPCTQSRDSNELRQLWEITSAPAPCVLSVPASCKRVCRNTNRICVIPEEVLQEISPFTADEASTLSQLCKQPGSRSSLI